MWPTEICLVYQASVAKGHTIRRLLESAIGTAERKFFVNRARPWNAGFRVNQPGGVANSRGKSNRGPSAGGVEMLVRAEGGEGVDAHGAAGGDPARDKGDKNEYDRNADERGWIAGRDAVEEGLQGSGGGESDYDSRDSADGGEAKSIEEHKKHDAAGRGAE